MCVFNLSATLLAKADERHQKLMVKADHIHYDDNDKTSQLRGNVEFRQGRTQLIGDQAYVFFTDNGKLKRVITYGEPAHYRTVEARAPDKGELHATANKIDYELLPNLVTFKGRAHIQQDGNSISADTVYYDMKSKALTSKTNRNSRSKVHIQPTKASSHDR
jgi:lipopolysaccharide export system protein LptA